MTVALWLSILLSATPDLPTIDALRQGHPELFTAPVLPEWPQGLPRPIETATGTILPPARAQAILKRLRMLDVYPSRCQARLDALAVGADSVCAVAIAGAVDVARTEAVAAAAAVKVPFPWSEVAVALAVGLVAGGALVLVAVQ